MKLKTACITVLAIALSPVGTACSHPPRTDTDAAAARITQACPGDEAGIRAQAFDRIMQAHGIPGAQLAYVRQGQSETYCHGVMRKGSHRDVEPRTVFQAASLSKVLAAYITLRLVDEGKIDLDEPLWRYWQSGRIRGNAAAHAITARMVLNHTSGLPNWQISPSNPAIDSTPLVSLFEPGARFSYSGEGFYLLQRTLEHITGLRWDELANREVFARFDMPRSSYLTRPAFDAVNASGHERDGAVRPDRVFPWENTAWTLVTSAEDYSRFIQRGLFRGEGLAPATHALLFMRSSDANDATAPSPADPFIDWGLGVGLQTVAGRTLAWHWGDNPGFKAFFMLDPATGESLVLFTNSENGLSSYQEVLELFFGKGAYPAVDWSRDQS